MASLMSTLLLLGVAASPARAAIAAWWNGIGPQILVQNDTTGQIRYSACNSYDQPIYSYTDGSVLRLSHKPKASTPLAGTGWWNEKHTVASIFYLDEGGNIANGLLNCNMNTGLFQSQGNWIISHDAPSIHPNSGLAALVLGSEAGYRVYYHDSDGAISELGFTQIDGWTYRGIVSNDINSLPALAAAFSGKENITLVSPRDSQNIATTRYNKNEKWYRTTLPQALSGNVTDDETSRADISINQTAPSNFSLPAWDGQPGGMGITIDSAYTRSLWYIGNDSSLYSVFNRNYYWNKLSSQSAAFWPTADKPNAELAVAYEFKSGMVRIYYMVKGQLSEVKFSDNSWKAWSTVAAPLPQVTQSATPTPTSSDSAEPADTGLSTGAKAGIGVGVSLGAIAICAIIAVIVLMRKKRGTFQQSEHADDGSTTLGPNTPAPSYGTPALARASAAQYENLGWEQKVVPASTTYPSPQQEVHQLHSHSQPRELHVPQPMYELASQTHLHELVAEQPRGYQRY